MKIFKTIILILSTILFLAVTTLGGFVFYSIKDLSSPTINRVFDTRYSEIYDNSSRLVDTLGENKKVSITYEELPPMLINALVSVEDDQFFYHDGINYQRIVSSLVNNITSSSKQGGSTITQQLVKNLLLSNDQTLKRKIQEAYLSLLLEKKMTKEEILEFYFNEIYFEPTIPGIYYASQHYFSKEVKNLSLVECATLVGLVKSPSYYHPVNHPERANTRKNLVLKMMFRNNCISKKQLEHGNKVNVENILSVDRKTNKENYPYQAYFDIVYKEVQSLTGINPFSTPLKIETYLDTSVQSYLDEVQKGKKIDFTDDLVQVGASVLSNKDSSIIGVIGGRNYDGMMLFNHAYDIKRQPASTMKPIFTYALAMEHLHFHEYSIVEDKPYTYPNTSIQVQNADKNYLGSIPLLDAIGYSRNTSTLYTLEKVIKKIGIKQVVQYLKDIEIMDEGEFAYPYAIGGMKYGVSPVSLSGAYAMLARGGNYLKPSTIKKISYLDTNNVIYQRDLSGKQVLSKESSYLMTSTLKKMVDKNYYNISYARPKGINICAKTGTNAYDDKKIKAMNYPSYADSDTWFSGYSKNYTISCWTGFDEAKMGLKTYFARNDQRRLIAKNIFRETLSKLEIKNQSFTKPNSLQEVDIVRGVDGNYLPNDIIPKSYIVSATFRKSELPTQIMPYPTLNKINDLIIWQIEDTLIIDIKHDLINDELYLPIFGEKVYYLTYEDDQQLIQQDYQTNHIEINNVKENFTISICEAFKNNITLCGESSLFSSGTLLMTN